MINLQVRTESGEAVFRGTSGVEWTEALRGIDPGEFPLLGSLLPFADTMFNSRQTERLRKEVSSPAALEIVGADAAREIERLCLEVESGSHLYLWFLGD